MIDKRGSRIEGFYYGPGLPQSRLTGKLQSFRRAGFNVVWLWRFVPGRGRHKTHYQQELQALAKDIDQLEDTRHEAQSRTDQDQFDLIFLEAGAQQVLKLLR